MSTGRTTQSTTTVISEDRASYVFGFIIYLILLNVRWIYKCVFDINVSVFFGTRYHSFLFEAFLLSCSCVFFYRRYVTSRRFVDLYVQYKTTSWKLQRKVSGSIVAVFVFLMFLPLVLSMYWVEILNKPLELFVK